MPVDDLNRRSASERPGGVSNRDLLDRLFADGHIHVKHAAMLDRSPAPPPGEVDHERVEGMMLGLAIGDALGNSAESIHPEDRRRQSGEIRDYLPNKRTGLEQGYPSDDTQLAFWTLEQMLEDGRFVPENVAERFANGHIFGIGRTVRGFLREFKGGSAWYLAGPRSAGNGALMRIAPILIPHLRSGTPDLWADTVLCAMMTHNDPASTAACVAFVNMLWQLLQMRQAPDPGWWLSEFVGAARELETGNQYRPRGGAFQDYQGSLWRFVDEKVGDAWRRRRAVMDACNDWFSGAYLLETVPSVLYILMCHANDPEEAIVRAVNDTMDNDTCAAIVGAAVGALHGKAAIPERWRTNLTGRTTDSDDGQVFRLLERAMKRWGTA